MTIQRILLIFLIFATTSSLVLSAASFPSQDQNKEKVPQPEDEAAEQRKKGIFSPATKVSFL
jgi:protein involved in sex pheromone biosynthesis